MMWRYVGGFVTGLVYAIGGASVVMLVCMLGAESARPMQLIDQPGWRITVCRPAPNCTTLRGATIPTLDLCATLRAAIERELGRNETAQCDWQVDG